MFVVLVALCINRSAIDDAASQFATNEAKDIAQMQQSSSKGTSIALHTFRTSCWVFESLYELISEFISVFIVFLKTFRQYEFLTYCVYVSSFLRDRVRFFKGRQTGVYAYVLQNDIFHIVAPGL